MSHGFLLQKFAREMVNLNVVNVGKSARVLFVFQGKIPLIPSLFPWQLNSQMLLHVYLIISFISFARNTRFPSHIPSKSFPSQISSLNPNILHVPTNPKMPFSFPQQANYMDLQQENKTKRIKNIYIYI